MNRRRLLAALAGTAGLTASAGCAGLSFDLGLDGASRRDDGGQSGVDATPTSDIETPTGEPVALQTVTVRNAGADATYVTVAVVERATDRTAFVDSRTIQPGAWTQFERVVGTSGTYRVVVETDRDERAVREWTVDGRLSGLEVVVGDDIGAWPSVTCTSQSCAVVRDRRAGEDLPIMGDGTGYWYAPAEVVVRNDGPERAIDVRVEQYDEALLDATFVPPAGAQVRVPLTFRSGTYRVAVGVDGSQTATTWYVPEEPSRYVRLGGTGPPQFGCGRANTVVRLRNDDDVDRTLALAVRPLDPEPTAGSGRSAETAAGPDPDADSASGSGPEAGAGAEDATTAAATPTSTPTASPTRPAPVFTQSVSLAADAERTLTPGLGPGRYVLTVREDGGTATRGMWWACAPHGAVDVRIDAAGIVRISQEFRQYVADPSRYR